MNWLAWDVRTFGAALVGAVGGGFTYAAALPDHELTWLVGLGLGLATALVARDRSNLRGWVLGFAALWASAVAQCLAIPGEPGRSFGAELLAFHESLGVERAALHVLGALAAGWLGARSLRPGAQRRLAGT